MVRPRSFSVRSSSPITQLLAAFGLLTARGHRLEVVGQLGRLRQHAGVVLGQAVGGDEPLAARLGSLGHRRPERSTRAASTTSGGRSGSGK